MKESINVLAISATFCSYMIYIVKVIWKNVLCIDWRREWLLTLVFWPGELHGQRSLAD